MNKVIRKKQLAILIYFQLLIFVILIPVFYADLSLEWYRNLLVFVFFECVLLSFVDKLLNVYQFFLLMMLVFNVVQPIFEYFGWYSYPPGNMIMLSSSIKHIISDKTLAETYKVLIALLMGTSFGWLVGMYKYNYFFKNRDYFLLRRVSKNRNLFKYFFYIVLTLTIIHNFIVLYYSKKFGYVKVMHLQVVNDNIPIILRVAELIFPLSGYAMLYLVKNKKEYLKYAILFMIPYMIQIFTGLRGEAIVVTLSLLFIYAFYFGRIKLKYIFSGGILLFLTAKAVGEYRFSGSISVTDMVFGASLLESLALGLALNGSSIGVIAYTIDLKDHFFNRVPFLFGYILAIFSFAPNYTYEGIQEKSYLAQHITFLLYPDKLYGGSTIGTAIGAEFYELSNGNMLIIFILSSLLLYFACYFIKNLFKNQFMFYVGVIYIQALLLSPRGSIMKIFNKESVISIMVLSFLLFLGWLLSRQPGAFPQNNNNSLK